MKSDSSSMSQFVCGKFRYSEERNTVNLEENPRTTTLTMILEYITKVNYLSKIKRLFRVSITKYFQIKCCNCEITSTTFAVHPHAHIQFAVNDESAFEMKQKVVLFEGEGVIFC